MPVKASWKSQSYNKGAISFLLLPLLLIVTVIKNIQLLSHLFHSGELIQRKTSFKKKTNYESTYSHTSQVAQTLKKLPAMQETWVWSLGRKVPCRRSWQPTAIFLPGEFHAQTSLVGYSPWGREESDTDWAI